MGISDKDRGGLDATYFNVPKVGMETRSINVKVGKAFIVELPGEADGGFTWSLANSPEEVHVLHQLTLPQKGGRYGGALVYFYVLGQKPGECTLHFVHSRSWAPAPATDDTYELDVKVMGGNS